MRRPADHPDRIPLRAEGLHLVAEPVEHGPLAPSVTLRVYAGGKATNVGGTFATEHAAHLAAAIMAAAKRASEAQLFTPAARAES
jgi:hypothetical protein